MIKPTISLIKFDDVKELNEGDKDFYLSPYLVGYYYSAEKLAFSFGRLPYPLYEKSTEYTSLEYGRKIWNKIIQYTNTSKYNVVYFSQQQKHKGTFDSFKSLFSIIDNNNEIKSFPRFVLNYGALNWNKEWNVKNEVELGLFPQKLVSFEEVQELLEKDNNKKLIEVKYDFFKKVPTVSQIIKSVVDYIPKDDMRNKYNFFINNGTVLIDPETNKKYLRTGSLYVELNPIKWIVDKDKKMLIQKEAIFPKCDYKEAILMMQDLIEDIFDKNLERVIETTVSKNMKKIDQENELLKKYNDKVDKEETEETVISHKELGVKELVEEITKLIPNYYGSINIEEYVNKLINDYNNKIKFFNSNPSESILSLETNNREVLYTNLLYELNNLLTKLRKYSEDSKDYRKMLDRIRNCDKRVDEMDKDMDDTSRDIFVIKSCILKFLQDPEMDNKLRSVLSDTEKTIIDKLKDLPDINDNKQYNLETLDELKRDFAAKMKPFLMELNEKLHKKNIVDEMKKSYKEIGEQTYNSEKDSSITFYLKNLNSLFDEIRKNGNNSDNERAFEIINRKIDYDQSLDIILKDLSDRNIALNRIILDIEERKAHNLDIIGVQINNGQPISNTYENNQSETIKEEKNMDFDEFMRSLTSV